MLFRSPHPDVAVPDVTVTELVLARAPELGDKAALVDAVTGRTLTYGDVVRGVRRLRAGLSSRGFGRGDVLALCAPNLPDYAVVLHAAASAGGAVTTVSPMSTAQEIAFQLVDAGARFLVTVPSLVARAREAAAGAGIEGVFVIGEAPGATPLASLLADAASVPPVEIDPRHDVVVLPYSSGTSGLPKGVMLSHRNVVANCCQARGPHGVTAADVVVAVLPFFHIYGMQAIMNLGLGAGATIVTMARFDLEQFLRTVEEHRVTRADLVPPIVMALATHPLVDRYDLSSLEVIMSAAAPLAPELALSCARRLGCVVKQGYGMTEASPATHIVPTGAGAGRLASVGPLLASTEAKVVDPATGAELGPGEAGEIWVRGPQVMKGYLNNPAATRETVDADGWLHTGDIGHADGDGWFSVVDRLKELIKYKGHQVAPAELEALLLAHPAVADAAVVPRPDEEAGEVPKAFVVLAGRATADELMAFVAERVAPYKRVRSVEFVAEIPKSPTGKLLRRLLAERSDGLVAGGR